MMTNKRALYGIPCILLLLPVILVELRGPYYFGMNHAPEYAYLFNSLNLLSLEAPAHTADPGTTVQEFGAAVILARWLSLSLLSGHESLRSAVSANPEEYLHAINFALNLLYCGLILVVSLSLFRRTGSAAPPLVFQFICLAFTQTFLAQTRVSAEPMLLVAGLLYGWALLPALMPESNHGAKRPATAVLAGGAFAFGCVTKALFVPLGALCLVLPGIRQKLRFAGAALVTAAALILPVYGRLTQMIMWFWSLFAYNGYYGQGYPGPPSPQQFFDGLLRLWPDAPAVYLFTAALALVLLTVLAGSRKARTPDPAPLRMFLFGCLAAYGVLIALNAKHYEPRYLIAAMAITPLAGAVVTAWSRKLFPDCGSRKLLAGAGCAFLLLVLAVNSILFRNWLNDMETYRVNTAELRQTLAGESGCLKVCAERASFQPCAVHLGNDLSGLQHKALLLELYGPVLKVGAPAEGALDFTGTPKDDTLREQVDSGACVVAAGSQPGLGRIDGYRLEQMARNGWESLVRLRPQYGGDDAPPAGD